MKDSLATIATFRLPLMNSGAGDDRRKLQESAAQGNVSAEQLNAATSDRTGRLIDRKEGGMKAQATCF